MNISIVTINYNGSGNTIKLLESLKNQTDGAFDVIVVDNASKHEDLEKLKNYQTEATNIVFIENDKNLGFSGGNNRGIHRALQNGSDWVVLLNNDAWVEKDFIYRLKANLKDKSGILGLAIDEGSRVVYAGRLEWFKSTLRHIDTPHFNKYHYAIGGAVAIHKDVFGRIGFLDENYFLYFEDADFSFRAKKAGVNVSFMPDVKVFHTVSATTKKLGTPMILRYHTRNALYFNFKNGPWSLKLSIWRWVWWIVFKQLVKIVIGKNREESKAILAGVRDFVRENYGKLHV